LKRIAVLGAGLSGSCVALELASKGFNVDLFDQSNKPLSKASFNNEGKIHLGFTYANDQSLNSAKLMVKGAFSFKALLSKWVTSDSLIGHSSKPYIYAVPKNSLLDKCLIENYFNALSVLIKDNHAIKNTDLSVVEKLSSKEIDNLFNNKLISTAFQTQEIAIDPVHLCKKIRFALDAFPNINQKMSTKIISVKKHMDTFKIFTSQDSSDNVDYAIVVNALWENRLKIETSCYPIKSNSLIHRYKVGLRRKNLSNIDSLPSVTFVTGAYGDTVSYGDASYVSWYPSGLISQEIAMSPAKEDFILDEIVKNKIIIETLSNLKKLIPSATSQLDESFNWDVVGGYITAWGKTGINDIKSELHKRYNIGVQYKDNYYSIDTGKFSLAPLFANEVAQDIIKKNK